MKTLLLLFLLLTTSFVSAQIVNIPDANFKAELIADGVDTNSDGEIQVSEALATISMSLSNSLITDLTGIEAFVNLETFQSDSIFISTLDLTNNLNLTQVEVVHSSPIVSTLTSIDVSTCIALEELMISYSRITTLDLSNNINLTALYIASNPDLETVFIKNGSDESSNMDEGSWMENWGFGNNPSLQYVCADDFQTVEIQQFAGADYPVSSFCTFSPGGDVNIITGVSQFDDEGNGCDAGDSNIPFTSFNIDLDGVSTNAIAYSNNQGVYNVYAGQAGTYTLTPNLENPSYFNISPSPADVVIPVIDNSIITQNFCVEAAGVISDLEVVIAPIVPARPGFEAMYALVYKNKGNQTLSGDVQFNYEDTRMDFVSSTTSPDIQGVGTLTFNFTDLHPYETETIRIVLDVNSPTDTPPVNIDDVLVLFADINPIAGDETPSDNSFTLDQIVVSSYDPNNIVCVQGEEVPTTYIGDYLHYVVNFENTGTAPAENVVVTMEINPTDFDRNSLQILSASHGMEAVINDNLIKFYFPSIDLDTGGHGNILFKIKTKSDLVITDEVGVQANIYFDHNFPIETNEALTTFRVLGVDEFDFSQITVYPNPANDVVKVQSTSGIKSVTVYDVQGRRIQTTGSNSKNSEVNISELKAGIYFFSIETENGTGVKKILKR